MNSPNASSVVTFALRLKGEVLSGPLALPKGVSRVVPRVAGGAALRAENADGVVGGLTT